MIKVTKLSIDHAQKVKAPQFSLLGGPVIADSQILMGFSPRLVGKKEY